MYQVATIPGAADGAAEAIGVALEVLAGVGVQVVAHEIDIGPERYLRDGVLLPPDVLTELRGMDALFRGSPPSSDNPAIEPGVLERGIVFGLRRELALSVNLRIFRGVGELRGVDVAIVRENSEGAYSAEGAALHRGTDREVASEVSLNTYQAVEQCLRFGFELALDRGGRLTLAHKPKVLTASGALWQRVAGRLSADYPTVTLATEDIDTCCARMVVDPGRYDVIVTDNVFGDILSDVACAAARAGSYSASAELTSSASGPSLFEPMHGAQDHMAGAPAGVSALAAISAAALMVRHLGDPATGGALSNAALAVAAQPRAGAGSQELAELVQGKALELMGHQA